MKDTGEEKLHATQRGNTFVNNVSLLLCRSTGQATTVSYKPERPRAETQLHLDNIGHEATTEVGKCLRKMPGTEMLDDNQEFQAGKVSKCASQWAEITSDFQILSNISSYKLEFVSLPLPRQTYVWDALFINWKAIHLKWN